MQKTKVISPVDGSVYQELEVLESRQVEDALRRAHVSAEAWCKVELRERLAVLQRFTDELLKRKTVIGEAIVWQMGRPVSFAPKEVDRAVERSRKMIELAQSGLREINNSDASASRIIRRRPYGVVLVIAPWNYPLLTAINTIVPALISGNAVILKPATQTTVTGSHIAECLTAAGLPASVFQSLIMSHDDVGQLLSKRQVDCVAFTGSVRGGTEIERAAAGAFLPITLELGGKDAAFVAKDAILDFTVGELVDGSFFNSGQSCCGIERIYVEKSVYTEFVERFVTITNDTQKLGNPTLPETTLGPVVTQKAADTIRQQVGAAVEAGAQMARGDDSSLRGNNYIAATVLTNVDHKMDVMTEETFGPVIGIMAVEDEAQALRLINDSKYGLTASIWTQNRNLADNMAPEILAGTVFVNRCDYLDPLLAWTGFKDSGRGCSLSELGFQSVTRPTSYYAR